MQSSADFVSDWSLLCYISERLTKVEHLNKLVGNYKVNLYIVAVNSKRSNGVFCVLALRIILLLQTYFLYENTAVLLDMQFLVILHRRRKSVFCVAPVH